MKVNQPEGRACFCLSLLSTSVASNPALSHNCRGITCNDALNLFASKYNQANYAYETRCLKAEIVISKVKKSTSSKTIVFDIPMLTRYKNQSLQPNKWRECSKSQGIICNKFWVE